MYVIRVRAEAIRVVLLQKCTAIMGEYGKIVPQQHTNLKALIKYSSDGEAVKKI